MTIRAKNRALAGAMMIAAAAVVLTLLPMMASSNASVREITVVAKDMAFYVDGAPEPNPTIVLRAGEEVRIRLVNQDPGMRHDFAIDDWTVATKMLEERGDEDVVTFRVPGQRGTGTYQCRPHTRMMTGSIRVE